MPFLEFAINGSESALLNLTLRIQDKKLSAEEEQKIIYSKDQDNSYVKYLQACIHAFGSKNIDPNPAKVEAIVNSIIQTDAPSLSWALNLYSHIKTQHPEQYSLEDKKALAILQKAARLNNPLAIFNLLNTTENELTRLELAGHVYSRLPIELQKKLFIEINKIESRANESHNSDLLTGLGHFYKEINMLEKAYDFYLRAKSNIAFQECHKYVANAPESIILKRLKDHMVKLTGLTEFLKHEHLFNFSKEDLQYLKPISEQMRAHVEIIKYELECVQGQYGVKNDFKKSEMGRSAQALQENITNFEHFLDVRDQAIEKLENSGRTTTFDSRVVIIVQDKQQEKEISQLRSENEKLKEELSRVKSKTEEEKIDKPASGPKT